MQICPIDHDGKGMFSLESIGVFVITPNRATFFFPEIKNLNFGDFKGCPS